MTFPLPGFQDNQVPHPAKYAFDKVETSLRDESKGYNSNKLTNQMQQFYEFIT
jgi:hypothetical protein